MNHIAEIDRIYEIKCNKYKERELTPEFRNMLFREALHEVFEMNLVSESVCKQ